jgi:Tfp pilus assembly protein PilO
MDGTARTYDRLVPEKQNLGPFLGQLSTELDAAGMQNTAVRALTKTLLGKCEQWPIEVRGTGNFQQVRRFLRSLESLPRLSSVTRLNLETDPAMNGLVTTELTLSIYNTRPN